MDSLNRDESFLLMHILPKKKQRARWRAKDTTREYSLCKILTTNINTRLWGFGLL